MGFARGGTGIDACSSVALELPMKANNDGGQVCIGWLSLHTVVYTAVKLES